MPKEKISLRDVSVVVTWIHEEPGMEHTLLLRTGSRVSPTRHWWLQPAVQPGGVSLHFSSTGCSSEDLRMPWLWEGLRGHRSL